MCSVCKLVLETRVRISFHPVPKMSRRNPPERVEPVLACLINKIRVNNFLLLISMCTQSVTVCSLSGKFKRVLLNETSEFPLMGSMHFRRFKFKKSENKQNVKKPYETIFLNKNIYRTGFLKFRVLTAQ